MTNSGPHISIVAETLFNVGNLAISNSILTSLIVSALLIGFAVVVRLKLKNTSQPKGLQNFAEWLIESFYNFVNNTTGDAKKTRLFLPLFLTFFLFIILNNWLGLLPGVGTITYQPPKTKNKVEYLATQPESAETQLTVNDYEQTAIDKKEEGHQTSVPIFRAGTADLNTTLALALVSVITTQIFGLAIVKFSYLKKFFNFSSPIMFFIGILELISELAKVISFAFRLFGNIFAGEVLLVVIAFLIPVIAPIPFYGLELFVGFIQALVFAMLSLVFFNMATESHDH